MKKGWNRCCFLFSNFGKPNSVAKKFQENKKKMAATCLFSYLFLWKFLHVFGNTLTLTRPIGLPPHAAVAQKIADQR